MWTTVESVQKHAQEGSAFDHLPCVEWECGVGANRGETQGDARLCMRGPEFSRCLIGVGGTRYGIIPLVMLGPLPIRLVHKSQLRIAGPQKNA